jgi:hypothetical protein
MESTAFREGPSAGKPTVEMNSGARERSSSGDGLYHPDSHAKTGTLPPRANMTLGGDEQHGSGGMYGGETPKFGQGQGKKAAQPAQPGEKYNGGDIRKGTLKGGANVQGSIGKKGNRDGSGRAN